MEYIFFPCLVGPDARDKPSPHRETTMANLSFYPYPNIEIDD